MREIPGVQTPAATLAQQSGSCRDFATLLIETCRFIGLGSRFVSGYLHCPATETGPGSTHAWAEVYLGRWVAVDPLLAQFPADAGRVRMLEGALARAVDLTRAIGNLSLETL